MIENSKDEFPDLETQEENHDRRQFNEDSEAACECVCELIQNKDENAIY